MPVFVPGQAGSLGVGVGAKIGKDIGSRFVRHGGIRNWNTHLNLYGQGTMAMKSHPNYGFPAAGAKAIKNLIDKTAKSMRGWKSVGSKYASGAKNSFTSKMTKNAGQHM